MVAQEDNNMNRFLISSFVALALVVGLMSTVSVARAQSTCPSGQVMDPFGTCMTQTSLDTQNAAAVEAQKVAANTQTDYGSGKDDAAYNGIMMRIMTLFAWLVGVAAITLDNAVYYTVVTMGNYVGHLSAIGVTWRILRDIGNIALIFGFLGIGISVILNVNWYGGKTKMLPMLLVAAVFLNFSLFFTEAVIDTGNLFATQFYKQINGGNAASAKNFDAATISNDGISNKIMAQLGLQSIYGQVRQNNKAQEIFKGGNPWIVGFMGILLFIITAFVLFSLAFILISRFIYLIFLIIFAPIGFAGLAVPQLKARADKWWSALFAQTITAPVLLLLLYVALAVITDAQFLTGFGTTKDWTGFVNGNYTGFASMMLSFLVAMGLLLLVTIQAKNLSAFGAGKATALAGKLTFGATAFGMRSTAGWGANKASKYLRSTRIARIPIAGTGLIKGLDKVATSNMDIRGAKFGGGLKGLGIETGDAHKGGYREDLKARVESRTKYAAEIKGKDFKDLSEEEQFELAQHQKELARLEKTKKDAGSVAALKVANTAIKAKEKEIETFNLEKGTEAGNKVRYAKVLTGEKFGVEPNSEFGKIVNFLNSAANTDAAKKIREEAKKSKDDKDLEALKKTLKKATGDDDAPPPPAPAAPAAPGGNAH